MPAEANEREAKRHTGGSERDHEMAELDDFGKVKFNPENQANTQDEQDQLDSERFYQARDDKPSAKEAPGGAGNPERPSNPE